MAFTKSIILWEEDGGLTEAEKLKENYKENILGRTSLWMQQKQAEIDAAVEEASDKVVAWFTQDDGKENSPVTTSTKSYQSLSLDVVISESHTISNEITSYPISKGFQISEHVIRKNPQFSLNGWVTDVAMPKNIVSFNTLGKLAGSMFARDSSAILGSLLGSAGNVVDNLGYSNSSPVKDAYIILKRLVNEGTIVHVSTILGTYENCVLRSVSIQQNVSNSTVLPVVLQFEKIYMIAEGISANVYDNENYVSDDLQAKLKEVENDKTGSYLTDLYGQLTKQGVNITQALLGVSYGSAN